MLRSITIKNFQIHKFLKIDLDPRVSTLVGKSDCGKSAVIRALRWLAFNRPQGDAFIRHGEKEAWVAVKVDYAEVVRERGPDGNLYQLIPRSKPSTAFRGTPKEYKSFGADVPADVAAALNLDPDLNVQRQHDAPFWFLLSPGEVSRELNAVVNLGLIDATLANVAAALRQAKAEAGVAKARLADASAALDRLVWVPAAAAKLGKIGDLGKALEEKRLKSRRLRDLLEGRATAVRQRDLAAQAKITGLAALAAADARRELQARRDRLAGLLFMRAQAVEDLELAVTARKAAEAALAKATKGQRCPVCGGKMG